MGVRPLQGRLLEDRDGPTSPRVGRDQRSVRRTLSAQRRSRSASASRFARRASRCRSEIVGVVPSLRHDRLDQAPRAEMFLPFAQSPTGSMTLVARTSVDPATLIETTKREIWTIDPMQTFYRTATLEELVDRTLITRRFALIVLTGFAGARAAAGGCRPLRRAEHDRVAVPQGDRRAHGARRGMARHPPARRHAGPGGVRGRRRRGARRRDRRREAVARRSCSA